MCGCSFCRESNGRKDTTRQWVAGNGAQTGINLDFARKLRQVISERPEEKIKMACYVYDREEFDKGTTSFRHCGTAGCIAGHAEMILAKQEKRRLALDDEEVHNNARGALNLNGNESAILFLTPTSWGGISKRRRGDISLSDAKKQDVLDELDYIIETGKVSA